MSAADAAFACALEHWQAESWQAAGAETGFEPVESAELSYRVEAACR